LALELVEEKLVGEEGRSCISRPGVENEDYLELKMEEEPDERTIEPSLSIESPTQKGPAEINTPKEVRKI
jgi:hypothetical protein